jgi:uncharacterized repeat protein (TIGR03803 family)
MLKSSKTKVAALLLSAIWLAPNVGAQAATLATLHPFVGDTDGANPQTAPIIDVATGYVFGTTNTGGPANFGTVYQINTYGAAYKTLYDFKGDKDGAYPSGITLLKDGDLYGVTRKGGNGSVGPASFGVIFKLFTRYRTANILHRFDGTLQGPNSPLVADTAGNFYGTTEQGKAFKFSAALQVTSLYSFEGVSYGLAFGPDDHLYATSIAGGTANLGALYRIATSGSGMIVHNFTGNFSGRSPWGALWKDAKGVLYGTAALGGHGFGGLNAGLAFEYTPAAGIKTVLTLTGSRSNGQPETPMGALVGDSQGYLYGTSKFGGKYGLGTVYKFKPFAAPTVLHSFTGKYPVTGLAIDRSDALYGVTSQGGDEKCNCGTFFKITQ